MMYVVGAKAKDALKASVKLFLNHSACTESAHKECS